MISRAQVRRIDNCAAADCLSGDCRHDPIEDAIDGCEVPGRASSHWKCPKRNQTDIPWPRSVRRATSGEMYSWAKHTTQTVVQKELLCSIRLLLSATRANPIEYTVDRLEFLRAFKARDLGGFRRRQRLRLFVHARHCTAVLPAGQQWIREDRQPEVKRFAGEKGSFPR